MREAVSFLLSVATAAGRSVTQALLAGEFLLEACESFEVAKSGLLERSCEHGGLLGCTTVAATTLATSVLTLAGLLCALALLLVLKCTAVREDDAL